jgi:cytochrome b subunit of formate dehydrogenase
MQETAAAPGPPVEFRRFDVYNRLLHGVLMFSFMGLAFTGMPLLFNDAPWAMRLAAAFGGGRSAGIIHRVFASLMIACFAVHVFRLMHRLYVKKDLDVLWGPASMTPQPRDVVELLAHLRWFLRLGPPPRFDHFTYWEKFDYWAGFWGMAVIGGSGLVLWFPEFFSRVLPGSWFNIALLIHGEEGLLAVGFIFTIHFFNSHLRPDKFPMDRVIFTGHLSEHELAEERPAEYERLRAARLLGDLEVAPAPAWVHRMAKAVALVAVTLGLIMVGLILYAVLFSRA